VHRCGRTARIGRSGESLALIGAEDEVNFKQIYHALKRSIDQVEMLDIKYSNLELMGPLVRAAQQIEKTSHREKADEKAAKWIMQTAKNADLELDDDLKMEVNNKLAGKKRTNRERENPEDEAALLEKQLFPQYDDAQNKDREKNKQREQAQKMKYDLERKKQQTKKYNNSSFLTPESITYLNQAI
jgi:superfamily II DNA/RNA helicase